MVREKILISISLGNRFPSMKAPFSLKYGNGTHLSLAGLLLTLTYSEPYLVCVSGFTARSCRPPPPCGAASLTYSGVISLWHEQEGKKL